MVRYIRLLMGFSVVLCFIQQDCVALVLGTDTWPPYEFSDSSGNVTGYSVELVEAVLETIDVDLEKVTAIPWGRAMRELEEGNIDILVSAVKTQSREERFLFPEEPLIESSWILFALVDRTDLEFSEWEDLIGYQLGVVRGYEYGDGFDAFYQENVDYSEVGFEENNFMMLEKGRVDYIICDYFNGWFIALKLGLVDRIKSFFVNPSNNVKYYAMFSNKTVSTEFVELFGTALREFKTTDEYKALLSKYYN